VIRLRPAGVVVDRCEVSEAVHDIDGVREKDVVIDKYLLLLWLVWVQRCQVSHHDGYSCLLCSLKEIIIDLRNGTVSLRALGKVVFWEGFDDLIFFVPFSDAFGIETIKRSNHFAKV